MSEFASILIFLVISLLVSLISLSLILFFRNSLIASYEFTMEKVLFVVRSLKEKLVRISIVVLFLFFIFTVYFLSFVFSFDLNLIWVKLKSMLLLRSFRFLFFRLLGWEVPFILLLCLVSGPLGATFCMQDPAGGQPQPQPGEQAMPPANPAVSGEAGPAPVFPYDEEEMIGGDSVLSIQTRLLSRYDFPSAEQIESARIEARDRFRMKVDIIRVMTPRHPEGDWVGKGARALDSSRTKTGELPFGTLCEIRNTLVAQGTQSPFFGELRDKVFLRKEDSDAESQA